MDEIQFTPNGRQLRRLEIPSTQHGVSSDVNHFQGLVHSKEVSTIRILKLQIGQV